MNSQLFSPKDLPKKGLTSAWKKDGKVSPKFEGEKDGKKGEYGKKRWQKKQKKLFSKFCSFL